MSLIRTKREYDDMLKAVRRASRAKQAIAVDTETTGLHLYCEDKLRGISVAVPIGSSALSGVESWYLPVSYPETRNFDPAPLIGVLNRHKGVQAYHNAIGVDFKGLADFGLEIPGADRYHDTQVYDWLSDENLDHRLKEGVAARFFGDESMEEKQYIAQLKRGRRKADVYKELRAMDEWKKRPAAEAREEAGRIAEASKKSWETFTAEDLAPYASRDAELTLMAMDRQVGPQGAGADYIKREHAFQGLLFRMIQTGIKVNPAGIEAQTRDAESRIAELAKRFEGVNLNSPPQLRKLIYEEWGVPVKHRTPKGEPSTAKDALEELEGHPEVRYLLEYRRLQKALSAYYHPLMHTIGPDGRIHPAFSSTRTVTGRLSCSNPNLMTIPRGDTLEGVRDLFVPEAGFELWEYDIVSAELYVQANFSGDTGLMERLERGDDLHAWIAEQVFGPDFTPLQRRYGKNLNYGFPYGIGPRKFANYMVAGTSKAVTECAFWHWRDTRWQHNEPWAQAPRRCGRCHICQAKKILDDYRQAMPRLVKLMDGLANVAKREGVLPLHVEGRYRHFRSPGRIIPYYTALNALVQGGVAEQMKSIMLELEPELAALGARLCLQVHDSLVIEVMPGSGPAVLDLIQRVSDELNPPEFTLPLKWSGSSWEEHD